LSQPDQVSALAGQLESAILSGELRPGEKLPSERDLSTRWGVSRSVVREALGRLASIGLVRSQHGSGTRVELPSTRQVEVGFQRLLSRPDFRLEHLAEVRLPLETTIAALAATRRTDEHLARLQATQAVLGDARASLEAHVTADLDFHATLADATGNPLFQAVLAPIRRLLVESRRRTLGEFGAAVAHEHHAQVLAAVAARDAAAAAGAMRLHLQTNFEHLHGMEE
jgi:GntR family transcriptional repressor for pyruvate dehydrogenase complex